jgi:hypothetical protein
LQRLANPAYLGGFLFSGLLRVAPYCVPGGIRVVSTEAQLLHNPAHSRIHPKYVQHLTGHASIKLSLDHYSHWRPSIGRDTAEGIDEVLG